MESIITLDSRNSDKPRCIALHFGRKKKGGQSLFSKLLENGVQGKMRDDEREREREYKSLGGRKEHTCDKWLFCLFCTFYQINPNLLFYFFFTQPQKTLFLCFDKWTERITDTAYYHGFKNCARVHWKTQ